MKTTTESLDATRVKLVIEVPWDEFKPELDKAYKTVGAQVTVPGFRKGKVPAAIIDQRVGREVVLNEALNGALGSWYGQAVQEAEVEPLGQPEIDMQKFEDGEPIEITAELDVRPTLDIPDASSIEVEVESIEVSDDDVTEQIDALRDRFATLTDVERAAANGDAVTIDLVARDKDGSDIEGGEAKGMPYTVGSGAMLDGLDEAIVGLAAEGETTFETELVGGELKGTKVDVTVKVLDVKDRELPELDEEFVQTVSEFDTVDEFTADVRERLTRGKRMEQAAEARDAVLEAIIEKVEAPIPDSLFAEELANRRQQIEQQLVQAGVTLEAYLEDEEQTVDEFEAELERNVRDAIVAQFILDQVIKDGDFEVDQQELSQHIMRRAQQSGQDPQSYVQHIMEHNHVPEMMGEVMRGKALASLVESAKVTAKDGSVVDLANLQADGSLATEDEQSEPATAGSSAAE